MNIEVQVEGLDEGDANVGEASDAPEEGVRRLKTRCLRLLPVFFSLLFQFIYNIGLVFYFSRPF